MNDATRLLVLGSLLAATGSLAQSTSSLQPDGSWTTASLPGATSTDRSVMDEARRLLADDRPGAARDRLSGWLKLESSRESPYLPEAYLLRGDALLALREEENALRDYERVVKDFPGSEQFVPALEREFRVAKLYLTGRRRRVLGLRLESGKSVAEEIIIRINERLPGSRLAEDALIELADYYYADRDLVMAQEAYDVFLARYPKSVHRARALQRRAFASIARFKGPRHDATGLVEARYQIEDFQREFPADAERLGMSDALIARLDDSAGEQLLTVGRWYLDRGHEQSARVTLSRLIRAHPGTASARQALQIFEDHAWPLPGSPGPDAHAPAPPSAGAPR